MHANNKNTSAKDDQSKPYDAISENLNIVNKLDEIRDPAQDKSLSNEDTLNLTKINLDHLGSKNITSEDSQDNGSETVKPLVKIKDNLNMLALDLATNYCTASFGEDEKKRVKLKDIIKTNSELVKSKIEPLLNNETPIDEVVLSDIIQHRNILIIGAGATYDSYKCIPLGIQVIERFNEKYKSKIDAFPAVKEKIDTYLKELRLQDREPDFENILSLYSELILTPHELRSEISELFNFRYSPSLFYELVAHLFKHSFIDVIINFNFDEILDQTIEEELGRNNYHHIISDGDCVPIDEMMVDGRLKIPIYIKPHGTVSHKSTLRFTKRHYLDVPEQIKEVIIKLIRGERGEVPGKNREEVQPIKKINLISVGFNMESLEFGDIIKEHLPAQSKIYHICYAETDHKRDPFFVGKVFPEFFQRAFQYYIIDKQNTWTNEELHRRVYTRIAVEKFNTKEPENKLTTPFAEIFSYIWNTLSSLFHEELTPRSIGRHEISSYLFYDPLFSDDKIKWEADEYRKALTTRYETNPEYFLDRTIVEIAMAINRNNGIVDITQLLGDRVGLYYKKYRDNFYKTKKKAKGPYSIYDLINQFKSKQVHERSDTTFSKNIFQLDTSKIHMLLLDKLLESLAKNKKINVDELFRINGIKARHSILRWVKQTINTYEHKNPEILKDSSALETMLQSFDKLIKSSNKAEEYVSIMVLFRLFNAQYLSQTFISNFQKNYFESVYNGAKYPSNYYRPENSDSPPSVHMLDEISNLFIKSNRRHYYCIRPQYHDAKNFLTESFSKSKLLHTTLSLEYTFRDIFLNHDWDIALIVSETGSMLDFLDSKNHNAEKLIGKKIIVLSSYDAIKQFYNGLDFNVRQINQGQDAKYQASISNNLEISKNIVYTFSLPAIQHNHHTMLFIKCIRPNEIVNKDKTPVYQITNRQKKTGESIFKMTGALYVYRQGFSNNLNPILIGVEPYQNTDSEMAALTHDFKKLLRIFSTTFCRALAFEGIKKIEDLSINFGNYQNWSPEEEVSNINEFLQYLYQTEKASFLIKKSNNKLPISANSSKKRPSQKAK